MNNLKFLNKNLLYFISVGYLILSFIALYLHMNIMYILAPYALLTFIYINYIYKHTGFKNYWLGFELAINQKGHYFKFYILASKIDDEVHLIEENEVEILKVSQHQVNNVLNVKQVATMMNHLNYLVYLPCEGTQIVLRKASNEDESNSDICSSQYDTILFEFNQFKNSVISIFKLNEFQLINRGKPKVFGWKLRNRLAANLTSSLLEQK